MIFIISGGVITCEAAKIMHLVASAYLSIHPSICLSVTTLTRFDQGAQLPVYGLCLRVCNQGAYANNVWCHRLGRSAFNPWWTITHIAHISITENCSLLMFGWEDISSSFFLYYRTSLFKFPYLTGGGSTTWSIKDHSLIIPFKTKLYWYIVLIRIETTGIALRW